jgi:hypothetical protein
MTITQAGATAEDGYRYLVAGIAHADGIGSAWRSTMAITNCSGESANIVATYKYSGGSTSRNLFIPDHNIAEWTAVPQSLFEVGGQTSGSVSIESDRPLIVTARTYSDTANGTLGQFLPGVTEVESLGTNQVGYLPQVKKTSDFRTNIGFISFGAATVKVEVRLFSATGTQLGEVITRNVEPGAWVQINDVFDKAGVGECSVGFATVTITSGQGPIWAYASIVDGSSTDPTTIPVYVQ